MFLYLFILQTKIASYLCSPSSEKELDLEDKTASLEHQVGSAFKDPTQSPLALMMDNDLYHGVTFRTQY